MNDARLAIILEAKNNASPAIKQTTGDLRDLDNAAGNVATGLSGIGKAAGIAGILALGSAAAGVTMELARTGAMVDQTRTAFMDLATSAGMSGQSILESLRAAARGSINDMALMETANRAMLLGVADNAEEFGQLMQIAEARGKALAVSTEQAFSDIVTGIGRQSALILDNLGIIVDTETAYARYAESVGKTAAQLTDAERKQAMLNDVIANSASIVAANNAAGENMVDQFERMDAAISNAQQALGELFSPTAAVIASAIADAAQAAADGMTEMAERGQVNAENLVMQLQGANNMLRIHQAALEDAAQGSEEYRIAVQRVAEAEQLRDGIVRQLNAVEKEQIQTTSDMTTAHLDLEAAMRRSGDAAQITGQKFAGMGLEALAASEALNALIRSEQSAMRQAETALNRSAIRMVDVAGEAGARDWIEQQNVALAEQRRLWTEQGYDIRYINEVLQPAYLNSLDSGIRKLTDTQTATRAVGSAAQRVNQEFESLRGSVAGILQGALNVDVGVDVADFLPREDAVNEQARRLADIMVNGFTGQDWMGAFAEGAPNIYAALTESGDPKAAAARLLADFQDGLVPELIDKDKAKDLVRRMLTGEQNMAQLAQEIASELSGELGVSTAQALAAAQGALGVGEATQLGPTGADAADAFVDGFDVALQELGPRAAATIEKSAASDAVVRQLTGAGRNAGTIWGDGFLAAVGQNIAALTESGDPKAAAARLLADFQDGLVPELIDKDKAKDLVRRMLTGEQNMAQLAQEIAGELSGELGVSTAQALAAAQGALGVGEATQLGPTGADAAGAFADGFDVALQELGPRAAATIEKSAASDAVVRQLTGAGRNAGTIWGDGFLAAVGQNIPQALIDILTMRVLPAVQGGMTAQAGAIAAQ